MKWTIGTFAKLNTYNRVLGKPRCAEVNALPGLIYHCIMK